MSKLRTAVIGVGHFGRYHADKYARLPQADLIALVDASGGPAGELATKLGARYADDYRTILADVDAVSIAVPTALHYAVARDCLEAGVHVLIEKPITSSPEEAHKLIALAARKGLILQVGHVERFGPAADWLRANVKRPLYVECNRIAPYKPRGTDITVVNDLMIHDIDALLAFVSAPIESVDAVGAPVLSALEDIANARLRFADGCVATLTASRISGKSERKMRIFQQNGYVSADFLARKITHVQRADGAFSASEQEYPDSDNLLHEVESFVNAVLSGGRPAVTGEDGLRALEVAGMVEESLRAHRTRIAKLLASG